VALTRNRTHGILQERSGRNLTGISGSSRDFKRGKTCSILFRFFNWYETFRAFRPKRNGINNSVGNDIGHSQQEGEEGRKPLRISPRSLDFTVAREPTLRQLRWRVEKTRRHCSTVPEGLLCNSWTF
jgi:hypothetical protein